MWRMHLFVVLALAIPSFVLHVKAAQPASEAAFDLNREIAALDGRPKLPPLGGDETGTPTVDDLLARVETFDGLSREHTTDPVEYDQTPPVGGMHNPVLQNCHFYSEPVGNEHAVHSLEHGSVWITYDPDLPAADIAKWERWPRDTTIC